jgi:hypothetical protein
MTIPKSDFVLNNPTYKGKILVGGRNLVLVLQENMQLGLFMITALDVWCLAFCRYL